MGVAKQHGHNSTVFLLSDRSSVSKKGHCFKSCGLFYKCIAKNAMWFFLLANLMTGMVNLSFQSALATDLTARMILIVYILVLCVIFNIKEELHT